jgi:hypothetical protein
MNTRATFGIHALLIMISAIVAATLFVWPALRTLPVREALLWLVVPHMFLRFIGLSFLVPGVVSPSLPKAWAVPAAYGDVAAGILAIIAAVGLSHLAGWAIAAVWIFNIWGAVDLLYALYVGLAKVNLDPGSLGAGYYLVTTIVPMLMVSHVLVFMLLLGGRA